ncbi:MAG: NAD(P)/FAD-dependent oxidoreductase [Pseudomonadota bacterium]|nr:NAD(P)/FAD-dependent oxidoreductase [Pseudomonadota bacterium]
MDIHCDVAIIGGGPGGSTCAGMLAKYAAELNVHVFERELFPRDHIGESQLPPIGLILRELGCWEAVEAANFPIKIGATFRWGHSKHLWDFEFMPLAEYREEPRPREFSAQARRLAFQVDRARYDQILLDHAQNLGCTVHAGVAVKDVAHDGDRVQHLMLDDGRRVNARHFVDASGNTAILRRALGVQVNAPSRLQNIAFWDYWENAEWAERFPGDATRVLVLSIGSGWIWFIPLGPTRTSIGYVCPRGFYSESGKRPEDLYLWALEQEPLIAELTARATRTGKVSATKDWSYVADRVTGGNWFLVGEAAGFADPILAAGMTLTQTSGREAAYTILALERGEHDSAWLRHSYDENQRTRITQHIRFADFWYSANGNFTDLQDYTREIAADAGLDLTPQKAFQWLGTGGFTHDVLGQVGIGGLDLAGTRQVAARLLDDVSEWRLSRVNRFALNLADARLIDIPAYAEGKIHAVKCFVRGSRRLPVVGLFKQLVDALKVETKLSKLLPRLEKSSQNMASEMQPAAGMRLLLQALELMLVEGWVQGRFDPKEPRLDLSTPREGSAIHTNRPLNERTKRKPSNA